MKRGPRVELVPICQGEFRRWVLLCQGAGRFGWREVGFLSNYREGGQP